MHKLMNRSICHLFRNDVIYVLPFPVKLVRLKRLAVRPVSTRFPMIETGFNHQRPFQNKKLKLELFTNKKLVFIIRKMI